MTPDQKLKILKASFNNLRTSEYITFRKREKVFKLMEELYPEFRNDQLAKELSRDRGSEVHTS